MRTIPLLTISNIFMTFAWYGHLKFGSEALWKAIGQLGHRFFRVLLPGAGKPHRLVRIHARAIKDDPRDHYAFDFPRILDFLPQGPLQMELRRGFCPHCGGSIFCFPQMVDWSAPLPG